MKNINIIIIAVLLLNASSLSANEALVARFIKAQTRMLQTQIEQLNSAISLTQTGISATDKYEKIGKPSFAATDRTLSQAGFSVKSYYRFKDDHKIAIAKWLSMHASKASQIEQLQTKRDNLSQTLEGAN